MKSYGGLLVSLLLAGCVVIPVPVERTVVDGKRYADSELEFVQPGTTSRSEVIEHLGHPTIWFPAQRILVYGLRQVESGTVWFVGAGYSGAGGLIIGERKEALCLVLDEEDTVSRWGRVQVETGETWLSAATAWAGAKGIEIPRARSRFVEEHPTAQQSLVYFYRPRDYQHFLPLVPPARKIPAGVASYADIWLDGRLVGQLRWQSYVVVRLAPGVHRFVVNADADKVENPEIYRSATIELDIAAASVSFVDVGIEAGRGTIQPLLVPRPRGEAMANIAGLRESW